MPRIALGTHVAGMPACRCGHCGREIDRRWHPDADALTSRYFAATSVTRLKTSGQFEEPERVDGSQRGSIAAADFRLRLALGLVHAAAARHAGAVLR